MMILQLICISAVFPEIEHSRAARAGRYFKEGYERPHVTIRCTEYYVLKLPWLFFLVVRYSIDFNLGNFL